MTEICGAEFLGCKCGEPAGHEPPHACGEPSAIAEHCYGRWTDDYEIVRYPTGETTAEEAHDNYIKGVVSGRIPFQIRRGGIRYSTQGKDE